MFNNLLLKKKAQLILKIPSKILSNNQLSLNEKLILGLDYTLSLKKGYNLLSSKQIGEKLQLHSNTVLLCRKNLLKKGYLTKDKRKYILTDKYEETPISDKREIYIPYEIYTNSKLNTGSKLLWGEYNSLSKGYKEYFAKRKFTADRLNVSEESITNWTKRLFENNLLKKYELRKGYCISQKRIITCEFIDGETITRITRIKNPQGEWVTRRPKMLGFEEWE